MSWRYLAYRLNGDGTEALLNSELPLHDVKLKSVLSGPGSLQAKISPLDPALVGPDGLPILREWSTAIYVEKDGQIRGGYIVSEPPELAGPDLNIRAASFTAYPAGQPHVGSWATARDVLDVVRETWTHLQEQPGGNLGMTVDLTMSGVDPGEPAKPAVEQVKVNNTWVDRAEAPEGSVVTEVTATLSSAIGPNDTSLTFDEDGRFDGVATPFVIVIQGEHIRVSGRTSTTLTGLARGYGTKRNEHGKGAYIRRPGTASRVKPATGYIPKRLNWWDTPDLGKEIDDALILGGADYLERHWWEGETARHHLDLGTIGARRHELRFAVGENVVGVPNLAGGEEDYATEVLLLGAGEGPTMKRGRAYRTRSGLRRVAVVSDKSVGSDTLAGQLARTEMSYRTGEHELSELSVSDHPNAPLGSFGLGDEVAVTLGADWADGRVRWVRIIAIDITPESGSVATLSVIPA
ncbi:MAG: hypothetical protein ACRCZD_05280 [Phycicoccus sp.]